jgi:hypothetical protein
MASTAMLGVVLPLATLVYAAAPPAPHKDATKPAAAKPAADFTRDVLPLIKQFCVSCHSGSSPAAGIALTGFTDEASAERAQDTWQRVAENISNSHMPPDGVPHPTQDQRNLVAGWARVAFAPKPCNLHNPGRVTMVRLNRDEYNNTVRDLTGLDLHLADTFPNDDVGYGFDNIGDVLSLSPILLEKYLSAAEKISRAAIYAPEDAPPSIKVDGSKLAVTSNGSDYKDHAKLLYSEGDAYLDHDFTYAAPCFIRAVAFGQQAGPQVAQMAFKVDGKVIQTVDVPAVEEKPDTYTVKVDMPAGTHRVAVAFTNDYYNPNDPDPTKRDRNLVVQSLEVFPSAGFRPPMTDSEKRILICKPTPTTQDAAARKILSTFAARAYRRPVTPSDMDRLMRCFHLARQQHESFERGIQLGLEACFVSPDFLFRVEHDPRNATAEHPINDFELASRLSYFLWSSMPDDKLFHLAVAGTLHKPDVLVAQAMRMLKDPRSHALADDFAAQWLTLRKLQNITPDRRRFPDWNSSLRTAMRTETLMFFQSVVDQDASVLDFLNGKYTFVNEQLAKHYGMEGVTGDQFRRVALNDGPRGGILTQASILTVTSNPSRTSPVKRGKWVLEQLLGTPPPSPPPGVPALADDNKHGPLVGTLRQRMEQHRKNPACAQCHAKMDPLGFGLENFDAVGSWRTVDGDSPVDASGVLPDGQKFSGPAELRDILMTKKDLFVRCFSDKLLTYALGRGTEPNDRCSIDNIVAAAAKHGYRFSSIVTAIVESDPFRMRRGSGGIS